VRMDLVEECEDRACEVTGKSARTFRVKEQPWIPDAHAKPPTSQYRQQAQGSRQSDWSATRNGKTIVAEYRFGIVVASAARFTQ